MRERRNPSIVHVFVDALVNVLIALVVGSIVAVVGSSPAHAATITASYESGYRNVVINGYGAAGMGTFRLRDGATTMLALCLEADSSHTRAADAYAPVANRVQSPELDALLWWLAEQPRVDADTGVAAAALTWYYAGARRSIGVPVWADGHRGFAPIGPLAPQPWDALPRFSLTHMIGLVAGSTHLDAAERRVVELHRLATALAGPWHLVAEPSAPGFRLAGRSGPIARRSVEVTIAVPGRPPTVTSVVTDGAGLARVDLPDLPDGARVSATAVGPGVHREWDGAGAVQRMATPSSTTVAASFDVAPLPRHVTVRKTSTDPTVGTAGARLELRDARGKVAATAVSGDDGVASFGPIDPRTHPEPYTVRETESPPGLVAASSPVSVGAASTDPTRPTTIDLPNEPRRVTIRVRKALSLASVGPPDRSGFRFLAVRRGDGSSHELVTGVDGVSEPVDVALGTYDVCETAVPDWATALIDEGCVELVVDLATLDEPAVTVDYVNDVPAPAVETAARDAADGDQHVAAGAGPVIDRVQLAGLIPGTRYEIYGEVRSIDGGEPAGIVASGAIVAEAPSGEVELTFDVSNLPVGTYVIVEQVLVDGEVVAGHTDLDDLDQRFEVVAPPTTLPATTSPAITSPSPPESTAPPATSSPPATTVPPATSPPIVTVPHTLPPTGSDAAAFALRLGDLGFVVGVGLLVAAGLAPRRTAAGSSTVPKSARQFRRRR